MWNKETPPLISSGARGLAQGALPKARYPPPTVLGTAQPCLEPGWLLLLTLTWHREGKNGIMAPFFSSYQECTTPGAPRGVFAVPAGAKAGLFARGFIYLIFFFLMKYYY